MKRTLRTTIFLFILSLALLLPAYAAEPMLDNVTDAAELLTEAEWQTLEQQARDISAWYDVGVYIITVDDYTNYVDGDIYDAADLFYTDYALGLGDGKDALLLVLSMAERDYVLIPYGSNAEYAFNTDGLDAMADFFLDDFGSDSWNEGFADYLAWSADYLQAAEKGEPYGADHLPMSAAQRSKAIRNRILIILLVPLAVAGFDSMMQKSKMVSVAEAQEASAYVFGSLNLTQKSDIYTHTTEERRTIEKDDDKNTRSGGGSSGISGKF